MKEIKVAIIAHGLGMTKGYSGEGYIYKTFFELMREKNIEFVGVSFAKPYDTSIHTVYILPFHLSRFDKYQRLLVYFSAKKVKPKLFLNASGTLLPLSNIAPHIVYSGAPAISSTPTKYSRSIFWRLYLLPFKEIVSRFKEEAKRAKIIANSYYSAKAISEVYGISPPQVIYPPVDVEYYSNAFSQSSNREDMFITIARFEEGKMIENSLMFAKLSGLKGVVVGNLNNKSYYDKLIKLKNKLNVNVEFITNAPREELLKILSKAKIYFHPTIGEHFGIPIVEAMASGVIPIVPKESGASEIVPEFSYDSIEKAAEIAKSILGNYSYLSKEMHERSLSFDKKIFKEKIFDVIKKYLEN